MAFVRESSTFHPRLQSMRGLAALAVAVGHTIITFTNGYIGAPDFHLSLGNLPLVLGSLVFQQENAVVFFYVLSGFVLSASLFRRQESSGWRRVIGFIIRRLGRILPIMWLSVLLTWLALLFAHGTSFTGVNWWYNNFFSPDISLGGLVRNLAGYDRAINTPLWSIQVELAMAPILPVIALVIARTSLAVDTIVAAGLFILTFVFWDRAPMFVPYAGCFYVGAVVHKLVATRSVASRLSHGGALAFALFLVLLTRYLWLARSIDVPLSILLTSLASALVVAFIVLRPTARAVAFLDGGVARSLGDASYSFYAFGHGFQLVVGYLILSALPVSQHFADVEATAIVIAIVLIAVPLNFFLSRLTFNAIERRGIRFSRKLADRIENRRLSANAPTTGSPATLTSTAAEMAASRR